MRAMDWAEASQFLLAGRRTATIATIGRDGHPHVVPVWFVLDGREVVFTTGSESIKGRALRRDPRLSICVDDDRPPFAYVRVDGVADLSEDVGEMLPWATRIGARYMGEDQAEAFGRRNAVAGELLVRVRPKRVVGQAAVAD